MFFWSSSIDTAELAYRPHCLLIAFLVHGTDNFRNSILTPRGDCWAAIQIMLLFDYGPSTRCGNLMVRELNSGPNNLNSSPGLGALCCATGQETLLSLSQCLSPLSCIVTGYCQM